MRRTIDPLSPWVRVSCWNLRLSCLATSNLTQVPLYVIKTFSFCLRHDVKKLGSTGLRHGYVMQFWPMEPEEKSWEMDLGKIFVLNKKSHPRENGFFNHMLLCLSVSLQLLNHLAKKQCNAERVNDDKSWVLHIVEPLGYPCNCLPWEFILGGGVDNISPCLSHFYFCIQLFIAKSSQIQKNWYILDTPWMLNKFS